MPDRLGIASPACEAVCTQTRSALHIVQERGGDYLCTLKDNQPTLRQTVQTLLTPQPFSPPAHGAEHGAHLGKEQEPPRNPPRPHGGRES